MSLVSLLGEAINNPDHPAITVLGFILVSPFGGPSYIIKMLPVYKLDSGFFIQSKPEFNQSNQIKHVGGIIKAIISDNNRINQMLFKKFSLHSPWRTSDDIF